MVGLQWLSRVKGLQTCVGRWHNSATSPFFLWRPIAPHHPHAAASSPRPRATLPPTPPPMRCSCTLYLSAMLSRVAASLGPLRWAGLPRVSLRCLATLPHHVVLGLPALSPTMTSGNLGQWI